MVSKSFCASLLCLVPLWMLGIIKVEYGLGKPLALISGFGAFDTVYERSKIFCVFFSESCSFSI